MTIHFSNTQIDIPVNDNSYRYRAIRGEHTLTLYYSLPEHVEIPVGAYCEYEGETYTLEAPGNLKKHNTRNFEYTLVMEAAQSRLRRYKLVDIPTRRLRFSLTAKPHEHLQMIVDNLNKRETGWTAGTCIEATEKNISYNHTYCLDALSQMANEFETEWEITGKTISLHKVEYNKNNPLPLSYGRGNGFRSGTGRTSGGTPVEVLFVQGGQRNIDLSKYGSRELLLPKNRTTGYDGQCFSGKPDYDPAKARHYITDADGLSIRRADKPLLSHAEDSLDCSHIYPSQVGNVTAVTATDAPTADNPNNKFYDFEDSEIPDNLNFSEYRIDGERMTIIFQSGMLAGKEFDIEQTDKTVTGYNHNDKSFKLVQQEIDGQAMPGGSFIPAVGDSYAVFGIMLPPAYVCNNDTQQGASWDMFREAAKYLYENEDPKFTFTGELDGIWAKQDWLNIGGRIKPGGYILFSDPQFQPQGIPIRITGIKDYINNPHSPTIELSNDIVSGSVRSDLSKIEQNEVVADNNLHEALQFTKRRFRDSQGTIAMLEDAMLDRFSNAVSPIAVQTMEMLVGDESLQFRFVDSNNDDARHSVTYNIDTKTLYSPAGTLQHLTLGITTLSPGHAANEYRTWTIKDFSSPPLTDAEKKYYLYAKVSKEDTTGEFHLSETAIAMDSIAGYYHLLMGVLNSEYGGERSYVSLYGFTEILPGRLTTSKIISADGKTYFDLDNNEIGGTIRFLNNGSYRDIAEILGKNYHNSPTTQRFTPRPDGANSYAYEINEGVITHKLTVVDASKIQQGHNSYISGILNISTPMTASSYILSFDYIANVVNPTVSFFSIPVSVYARKILPQTTEWKRAYVSCDFTGTTDGSARLQIEDGYGSQNGQYFYVKNISIVDSESTLDNLNYLKEALQQDTTITGGLISSSVIRLGQNGIDRAGINGVGKENGDVRIWAGSPFANRESAPFRVLQDGSVVMTKATIGDDNSETEDVVIYGSVYAESGKIGGFTIRGNWLTNIDNLATGEYSLDAGIYFTDGNSIIAAIGTATASGASGLVCPAYFENTEDNILGENIALLLKAMYGGKNTAIRILNGDISMSNGAIRGFAVNVKSINDDYDLTYEDSYIACYNVKDITLKLPITYGDTKKGKMYYVKRMNGGYCNVRVECAGGVSRIYLETNKPYINIPHGDTAMFVWDGSYWLFNVMPR